MAILLHLQRHHKGLKEIRVAHAPAGGGPRGPMSTLLRQEREQKRPPRRVPRGSEVVLRRKTIKGVACLARCHSL